MVLSNRKLKQQLREKISDSLLTFEIVKSDPATVAGSDPDPNPNAKPISMRALLGSATQKPVLSKRAKRRKLAAIKVPASGGEEGLDVESGGLGFEGNGSESVGELGVERNGEMEIGDVKKKEKKKRKRDVEEEKSEDLSVKEEAKKPKTKKKPKWKKRKEAKGVEAEESKGFEVVREDEKGVVVVTEEPTQLSVEKTSDVTERQANSANGEFTTKVYVGGIPYYSTEDDIRSYFESCGSITDIDCMRFPDSGKFKGIGIITFRTEAAAKRALAFDGEDMGGLYLKIQPYNKTTQAHKVIKKISDFAPEIVEGYNRIYVGNLSWDITEDELRKLFSGCTISSINFGTDKETGEFRGYAHVEFSDSLSLTMALKLDQKVVLGRPVKISCAVPLRKPGIQPKSLSTSTGTLSQGATTASAEADNSELSGISGKLKRRTCYECGEKGHVSSLCPLKKQVNVVDTTASEPKPVTTTSMLVESVKTSSVAADTGLTSVGDKVKRRTCYECGEKGHLSTACPKKQSSAAVIDNRAATFTTPVRTTTSPAFDSIALTTNTGITNTGIDNTGLSSGKIKRRTCYECGEKGHVSSACPKKQYSYPIETPVSHTKSVLTTPTPFMKPAATNTSTEPSIAGSASMSSKIKKRNCYECGEKGHISSACPKKQSANNVS